MYVYVMVLGTVASFYSYPVALLHMCMRIIFCYPYSYYVYLT